MAIFISHTTPDNRLARNIYNRLNYHGIECYIDDLDNELKKRRGNMSLTPFLVDRLEACDTLLAVVTENTKSSWWVPFEIGTARQMPRVITSYTNYFYYDKNLPEYLLEWPLLRTENDIDVFSRKYKRKRSLFSESVDFSTSLNNVRSFEKSVMFALGQVSHV